MLIIREKYTNRRKAGRINPELLFSVNDIVLLKNDVRRIEFNRGYDIQVRPAKVVGPSHRVTNRPLNLLSHCHALKIKTCVVVTVLNKLNSVQPKIPAGHPESLLKEQGDCLIN